MTTMHFRSRIGSDGILKLDVPTGLRDSDLDVVVMFEGSPPIKAARSLAEWVEFVGSTAGSISDPTFIRQPQGEFETREELA